MSWVLTIYLEVCVLLSDGVFDIHFKLWNTLLQSCFTYNRCLDLLFFFLGCHLIYFTSHSSFLKTPSLNYHQKAELCSHIVPFANFFMIIGNDIQCKLWPVYLISLLCHLRPVCHQVLLFLTSCFQIYLFYRFPIQVFWRWGNNWISGPSPLIHPSHSSEDHLLPLCSSPSQNITIMALN